MAANGLVLLRLWNMLECMDFSKNRQVGFTLVEVIIALTVFSMVISGGLLGISRGFQLVDTSRNYTRSSQVLQSELELLRTLPWLTFTALSDDELTEKFQSQITSQFNEGDYTGSVETDMTGGDLMEVIVTVEWEATRTKRTHSLSYTTYFTEGGVNDYYIN